MLAVISPSKTMHEVKVNVRTSTPRFQVDAELLAATMKKYDPTGLMDLMDISAELAEINFARYQGFSKAHSYPAAYLYRGDVFRGLAIDDMDPESIKHLNRHIRILSGLYGYLKPLDRIKPYRLEMCTKVMTDKGPDLYSYWGDKLARNLELESDDGILLNIASKEYSRAVIRKDLKLRVVDVEFREKKGSSSRIVPLFSKIARGMMARYISEERVNSLDGIKGFSSAGYCFEDLLSNNDRLVFIR
ncbi:YaaA family protein [Youngiibacter multivorans]|uniref:UPF0246 protein J2Z34_000615 n=1 Tax=Youngiibacter multivorans TaxID=937251 RepID=A0ABS4G0R7_9CLOT|nr:YaaA family protein [Youngiibacter multivorans]MBP1918144.1 cytoplasmic iron level regulating protein YaaA (DUF328/UPF0246 family) [Youngiibacter multivorans]